MTLGTLVENNPFTHLPRKFSDAMTADHKFLNEEDESRLQHCYAVVVQGLYSYWIQRYPTKNKTAQKDDEQFAKARAARSETSIFLKKSRWHPFVLVLE